LLTSQIKELVRRELRLPPFSPAVSEFVQQTASPEGAGCAADFVDRGLATLCARAATGDVAATQVLALFPDLSAEDCRAALAKGALAGAPDLTAAIYAAATEEFDAGRLRNAIGLLASLISQTESDIHPLVGLAVCAIRMERFNEADLLASESIRRGFKHPQLFCVAGLCRLESGDRDAAMDFLARAARAARQSPEFREDLRFAQRLLISMHYESETY
jgi:Flp pilus assembly protein TadD